MVSYIKWLFVALLVVANIAVMAAGARHWESKAKAAASGTDGGTSVSKSVYKQAAGR